MCATTGHRRTYEDADPNAAEVEAVQELVDLRHLCQHSALAELPLQLRHALVG
jgi:hypothetical protein